MDDLLIGSRTATSGSPRDPSQYPHALLGSRRLFKIAHLNDSPTQIVMIDLADSRLNMELTFNRGVSHEAACLPSKKSRTRSSECTMNIFYIIGVVVVVIIVAGFLGVHL